MTDQATRIVPAGWYEDPASSAHVRWWNGLAWTEHTTLKPTTPPQPQVQVAAQQAGAQQAVTTATGSIHTAETLARIAEARELERQYGISTAEHDAIVDSATAGAYGYATTGSTAIRRDDDVLEETVSRRSLRQSHPEDFYGDQGAATASAWFIALWPVLTLVAAVAAGYVAFFVNFEPSVAGIPLVAGLVLVPLLLTLVWAATDARRLRQRGHRPASPGLAFLGPLVYLIARRVRVPGSGPLVTLILLSIVAIGGPVAAYYTGAAAPVTKALEIQQTIQSDLVGSGRLLSVTCPIFVESTVQGSLYTCAGTRADGLSQRVWVSIDSSDGDFSYALEVR